MSKNLILIKDKIFRTGISKVFFNSKRGISGIALNEFSIISIKYMGTKTFKKIKVKIIRILELKIGQLMMSEGKHLAHLK